MYSGDKSCIVSTLDFVCNNAMKHNLPTIVTFYQPLYWKAAEIIIDAPQSSHLKGIVLMLGCFHELAGGHRNSHGRDRSQKHTWDCLWRKCSCAHDDREIFVLIIGQHHFYDLNVFFAPKNLGIDTKIIKFELIVTELWSLRGYGGHLGRHLEKKTLFRGSYFGKLLVC